MSSLSHTLSFSSSRPQQRQLSPPHSHKSENHILPRPFATMSTNNNGGKTQQTHSYFGMSNTGSSMDNPHTPPTPPMLSLSNSSKHHQQKQTLPSLPKILEPPFAPSSAALFSTSTTATSPYPAIPTAASASNITINTPFTSSTSVDSSSSSSSPLHHCKWRNCIRSFHGPEQLYQHLCDEHVGRHARGNLCLECRWEDCQTVTNKRDHITSHLRVHVPLTPLRCRICDKRYKRRQDLKKHERKHMERLELSSTQLAGSELSSIVHPLPGTVLPDIHHPHSRHATVGTSVQHHHPYSAHSYSPSASSSTTSLRSGSPSYRPLASPGAMPPQLPSVNLHPHYSQHSSHPQPSHTHYSHQHSTLPALTTPGASASPPSFTVPLGNGTRNGSASSPSLVPQSAMDYSPQSYHAHSQSTLPPSTFAPHHSTAFPQPYVYSQQPSHPPMASNPPSMSAPPSHTRHVQSVPHLPLPPVTQINGYHRS